MIYAILVDGPEPRGPFTRVNVGPILWIPVMGKGASREEYRLEYEWPQPGGRGLVYRYMRTV